MTTTPLMPNGLNSWKTTSTMVAWARFAASIKAPLTASRLLMASGSQSNISSSRCRPRAFKPVVPLSIRSSTAPLLRRFTHVAIALTRCSEKISLMNKNLLHCRVRFHPLQEKNAFPAASERFGSVAKRCREHQRVPPRAPQSAPKRRAERRATPERADRGADSVTASFRDRPRRREAERAELSFHLQSIGEPLEWRWTHALGISDLHRLPSSAR